MGTRKTKTIKFDVLEKGVPIDYQTVIEQVIGDKISGLSCYDGNWDSEEIVRGYKVLDSERAYFIPDCDYEIIIRPKK